MAQRKLAMADAMFLTGESRRTPMHVGGLHLFTLPKGVDETEYLAGLADILSYEGTLRHPFGDRLKLGPLGSVGPAYWEPDDNLDMEYHIRHSALPKPGRYRELFALVSRLHSTLLDRSRPLWEMHLIEGLPDRQFATYFKTHHCAMDGAGSMHLMNSMYTNDPRSRPKYSPYSQEAYEVYRKSLAAAQPATVKPNADELKTVTEVLRQQMGGAKNVGRAMGEFASVWLGMNKKLAMPMYQSPRTPLSAKITGARRFVAQSWPFERVRAVGKAFNGTLNDAVLGVVAGALRQHLLEQGELPKHSLKAMAPVSLRQAGDLDSANAVGFITANLGTNEADPAQRMRVIQESMIAGKEQLQGMSQREVEIYTMLTQAPMLLTMMTGSSHRFPAFSTVVSNVPGPREQLYWNGARLDGVYPASIPADGYAVNFTVVSNYKNLDFGIVACRKTVPHVQRFLDYMEQALVELEDAAGLKAAPAKRKAPARPKVPAKKKPAAKRKAATPRKKKT
jgi:diacylglycerol O-acyltransferase